MLFPIATLNAHHIGHSNKRNSVVRAFERFEHLFTGQSEDGGSDLLDGICSALSALLSGDCTTSDLRFELSERVGRLDVHQLTALERMLFETDGLIDRGLDALRLRLLTQRSKSSSSSSPSWSRSSRDSGDSSAESESSESGQDPLVAVTAKLWTVLNAHIAPALQSVLLPLAAARPELDARARLVRSFRDRHLIKVLASAQGPLPELDSALFAVLSQAADSSVEHARLQQLANELSVAAGSADGDSDYDYERNAGSWSPSPVPPLKPTWFVEERKYSSRSTASSLDVAVKRKSVTFASVPTPIAQFYHARKAHTIAN